MAAQLQATRTRFGSSDFFCGGAKRFIRYLTPCPESHAECWAGNAPTALHEKATVQLRFTRSLQTAYRPTHEGFTTAHVALLCSSPAVAKLVIDDVRDAGSIVTSNGLTLLHAAALGGQPTDILQLLVQRGCNKTAKDAREISVMHYAALGGCVETVKFVLANGGSMTDKTNAGGTAMMAAALRRLR